MFARVSGMTRWGVARLNADGTLDDTFDAGLVSYPYTQALALLPDGRLLASGDNFSGNNWNRKSPAGNAAATHVPNSRRLRLQSRNRRRPGH